MTRLTKARRWGIGPLVLSALMSTAANAHTQGIGANCTASVLNRTVRVNPNGTFTIPDIPVGVDASRVRVVCKEEDGTIREFLSDVQTLIPNGQNLVGPLTLNRVIEVPVRLEVVSFKRLMTALGETTSLSVRGTMPGGEIRDLTSSASGTTYLTSNAQIAIVSPDGLVTATGRGHVILSARNEGVLGTVVLDITTPNDADQDGLPDDYERANGLNPSNRNDAAQDVDNDGLTSLAEFQLG